MKCFLASVLLVYFATDFCDSALIGSSIKSLITIPDTGKQNVCKSGVKTFCHKEVRSNVTPTLSKMCVDGKIKLVRIPEGYRARTDGLKRCVYAGKTFCDGDNILPNYKGWSTRHYCLNGDIRYSVSGRRLKTNRSTVGRPSASSSSNNNNNAEDDDSNSQAGGANINNRKPATTKKPLFNPFAPRPQSKPENAPGSNKKKPAVNKPGVEAEVTSKAPPPIRQCKE